MNDKYGRININKVDPTSGDIESSSDYGFGYTINWEPVPFDVLKNNDSRCGAYLEDIICACIDRLSVLQISKYKSSDYEKIKGKLFEVLDILKEKSGE